MIRPHNSTATAVVLLGDDETVRRCEQLTARAALRSATIAAMFAFTAGAPASHDDLTVLPQSYFLARTSAGSSAASLGRARRLSDGSDTLGCDRRCA